MQLLYKLGIFLYGIAVKLAAFTGNAKARKWVNGRRDWKVGLDQFRQQETRPLIWMHAASLGEFEQGRPIIERLKKDVPNYAIVLTFFSPSGYEIRKNYAVADHIAYLPLDTASNARYFVQNLNPKMAIFIKYEFWFNYLKEIKNREIPLYLVSGIFRKKQSFFKPMGGFFRSGLSAFTHFFVQDENSKFLLNHIDINQVTVAGDTRFDRVNDIKQASITIEDIARFSANKTTLIIGSSWPKEEGFLQSFLKSNTSLNNCNFIIAPHNIDESKLNQLAMMFEEKTYRYSQVKGNIPLDCRILIIDSIGLLSSIYAYSDIAIIGGGFGAGIHNTLEAAIWNQPVMFGPNYQNFKEAIDLIDQGGAFTFSDQIEFDKTLTALIKDEAHRNLAASRAGQYCADNIGAVDVVMKDLLKNAVI